MENIQEIGETETTVHIVPETIIAILVLIMTFLQTIKSHVQKIPDIWRETAQAITEVTRTTSHNMPSSPHRIPNRKHHHMENQTGKRKLNNGYDRSYNTYHTTALHDNYD